MPGSTKPLMIFDGDCHFCRGWIARWKEFTGEKVDYVPFQDVAHEYPQISLERFRHSVQLIEADGNIFEGAEAVFRALARVSGGRLLLWAYRTVPGFGRVSEIAYRFVAGHRQGFSTLTRWLWGAHIRRPTYRLSSWLFLRNLGAIYLVAFVSLGPQLPGLVGDNGILPAAPYLERVGEHLGGERFWLLPTLCWLDAGERFLKGLWLGGAVLSGLLIMGVAPGPLLMVLWVFYLSLSTVCRDFLGFQWDILLLETGFLGIFLAPWRLHPRLGTGTDPPHVPRWLLNWLLFRLILSSGVVKLASGDPTWWSLSALNVHYETQPLPTWVGWFVHQMPAWAQALSASLMFLIELAVPFLLFLPRRARILAFWAIAALMATIALTGNYGFFNWLTFALCLLLLDDAFLNRFFPRRLREGEAGGRKPQLTRVMRSLVAAGLLIVMLPVSSLKLAGAFRRGLEGPEMMKGLVRGTAPFRSINGYGLFAQMTTTRSEIVLEGSNDGAEWLAYEFKWKPGDPGRRPAFVAPHMPRLDWQMWFAALSGYRRTPWFSSFMVRLLQGSPDVLALLEQNPFPDAPPRYLRAVMYQYRFTDCETRRKDGSWWQRERQGLYVRPLSLRRE